MIAEGVVGIDEVGRGPLAGPVVAAAVILHPARPIQGLRDSKRLVPARREELAVEIRAAAVAWALGRAEVTEIDEINIFQASLLAMRRAVMRLPVAPRSALVDGTHCPPLDCPARAVIGGDDSEPAISAASILAKVARDAEMCRWGTMYHRYGFDSHKGYGTRAHRAALARFGASPIHRRSFAPVRDCLDPYPWSPLPIVPTRIAE